MQQKQKGKTNAKRKSLKLRAKIGLKQTMSFLFARRKEIGRKMLDLIRSTLRLGLNKPGRATYEKAKSMLASPDRFEEPKIAETLRETRDRSVIKEDRQ